MIHPHATSSISPPLLHMSPLLATSGQAASDKGDVEEASVIVGENRGDDGDYEVVDAISPSSRDDKTGFEYLA